MPERLDPFERAELEFGSCEDAKLTVSRYLGGGRDKYLCRVNYVPGVHTPEWLRARFGPDRYRLCFGRTGDPRVWSQVFAIAPLGSEAPYFQTMEECDWSAQMNAYRRPALGGGRNSGVGEDAVKRSIENLVSSNKQLLQAVLGHREEAGRKRREAVASVLVNFGKIIARSVKVRAKGKALQDLAHELEPVVSSLLGKTTIPSETPPAPGKSSSRPPSSDQST